MGREDSGLISPNVLRCPSVPDDASSRRSSSSSEPNRLSSSGTRISAAVDPYGELGEAMLDTELDRLPSLR